MRMLVDLPAPLNARSPVTTPGRTLNVTSSPVVLSPLRAASARTTIVDCPSLSPLATYGHMSTRGGFQSHSIIPPQGGHISRRAYTASGAVTDRRKETRVRDPFDGFISDGPDEVSVPHRAAMIDFLDESIVELDGDRAGRRAVRAGVGPGADDPRGGAQDRGVPAGRDRRGHGCVPDRGALGVVGRDLYGQQRLWRPAQFRPNPARLGVAQDRADRSRAGRRRVKGTYLAAHHTSIRGRRGTFKRSKRPVTTCSSPTGTSCTTVSTTKSSAPAGRCADTPASTRPGAWCGNSKRWATRCNSPTPPDRVPGSSRGQGIHTLQPRPSSPGPPSERALRAHRGREGHLQDQLDAPATGDATLELLRLAASGRDPDPGAAASARQPDHAGVRRFVADLGCWRVATALNREGIECSVGLVTDLMRELGPKKRYNHAATSAPRCPANNRSPVPT